MYLDGESNEFKESYFLIFLFQITKKCTEATQRLLGRCSSHLTENATTTAWPWGTRRLQSVLTFIFWKGSALRNTRRYTHQMYSTFTAETVLCLCPTRRRWELTFKVFRWCFDSVLRTLLLTCLVSRLGFFFFPPSKATLSDTSWRCSSYALCH